MGSVLPGGYSTMTIRPSLPGRLVRSFEKSSVTLASCASSVPDMRHASAKTSFGSFINYPFARSTPFQCVLSFTLCFAVTRSGARVAVLRAASLPSGDLLADLVTRKDSRPVAQSHRAWVEATTSVLCYSRAEGVLHSNFRFSTHDSFSS